MNIFIKTTILLLCIVAPNIMLYSQNPSDRVFEAVRDYAKKENQKKECLSMQLLKSASEITYVFSNGALPPEYTYVGYIIVTPHDVTLTIYHMSKTSYKQTRELTTKQYSKFLTNLFALGVKKKTECVHQPCGSGSSYIEVKKGDKILFDGNMGVDADTSNGRLSDAFVPLLTRDMRAVYDSPNITFGTITDNSPVDYLY